jgi:hypothetical protein
VLAGVTLGVYWPLTGHPFINFDDDQYIAGNPHVTSGLSWNNVVWAFQSSEAANWHPLTWISHMIDCDLFGLNPGGHHLMNLFFHIANTLLLFLLLKNDGSHVAQRLCVGAFCLASVARRIGGTRNLNFSLRWRPRMLHPGNLKKPLRPSKNQTIGR